MLENAQLISLSKQIALRRQMDVVANNMANINTTGFKNEALLFEEYVMPVAKDRNFQYPDQPLSYTQDWATVHDFKAGAIQQTGNTFDVALQGDGFFTIQTPAGDRYTRNGEFKLNNDGVLVDNSGSPVMSEGGVIRFAPEETDITINGDGTVSSSAGVKGRLAVVSFEDPQALEHAGENLFTGEGAIQDLQTVVVQGAIERSNVSGVTEMANMIKVSRAYQSLTNLMERQDDLRSSAINKLGDLQA